MHCNYCRSWNADDEHRCNRCGRRLKGTLAVSQNYPASRSASALAFAERPAAAVEVQEPSACPERAPLPETLSFGEGLGSNVIPFESFAADRIQPVVSARAERAVPAPPPVAHPHPAPPRNETRRRTAAPKNSEFQPGLDFLLPTPQGPRTLKTQVEAVIYCDADVAPPVHRAIAAALDGGMIFVGFGVFLFTFHLMGGMFRLNRQTIPFFIGVLGTLVMFYGMLWIWADRETLGMRWTGLRLIDFDGFPADRRDRILRILGACLSFCAGGIGLLWALVDEEKLAWHDHMSKTFPTLQESNSPFFRKG
jgi:uncharacterized RDD family membrane protein YckC